MNSARWVDRQKLQQQRDAVFKVMFYVTLFLSWAIIMEVAR